jgi:hypothetical protein
VPPILDLDALLTGTQAAMFAEVSVQAVGNWRTRGYRLPDGTKTHLQVATDGHGRAIRDGQGRPMYRLRDVIAAEAATAGHAKRAA